MIAAPLRLDVGLHHNIKAVDYHADPAPSPSLSSGVARTILGKSLAHAFAEHPRLGGSVRKIATAAMDTGSLVHALLAGTTADEIEVETFANFRSKAAQDWAAGVRDAGKIPALRDDMEAAQAIADAVRAKATLGTTDDPFGDGYPEVTAIWSKQQDGAAPVFFRARYDRLVMPANEPWTAWDWKVTGDVSPGEVRRKIRRFGYHHQAAHYLDGMNALCPAFAGRHSFIFVFVEDSPPYSVRRYCITPDSAGCAAIDIGRAHDQWAHALRTNKWPDASSAKTTFVEVPSWDDEADINLGE